MSIAVLQESVANEGDAWAFSLDAVGQYFERILVLPRERRTAPPTDGSSLLELARRGTPAEGQDTIGAYAQAAWLLGKRTAEMHIAFASAGEDPAFAPEPFSPFYRRSLYQSMRTLTEQSFALLRRRLSKLPEDVQAEAERLAAQQDEVLGRFHDILGRNIMALRTRVHGDYHLGQVLRKGADFVIIDFEGEPALPLSTRRLKRCPLRDTAGMIRSFHYASHYGLSTLEERGAVRPDDRGEMEPWAHHWYVGVSAAFLRGYLEKGAVGAFLPRREEDVEDLLTVYLLGKAMYELSYELNNRPSWVGLPLAGIRQLLEGE
jgi:maltose alpha-D-glucosyltransferase/alpha-amylase